MRYVVRKDKYSKVRGGIAIWWRTLDRLGFYI